MSFFRRVELRFSTKLNCRAKCHFCSILIFDRNSIWMRLLIWSDMKLLNPRLTEILNQLKIEPVKKGSKSTKICAAINPHLRSTLHLPLKNSAKIPKLNLLITKIFTLNIICVRKKIIDIFWIFFKHIQLCGEA